MTKHLANHLKHNLIAYVALFIALGGSSYAATSTPQHTLSLKAVKSAKAGITCGGGCPANSVMWAYINTNAVTLVGVGPAVTQTALGGVPATVVHAGVGSWVVHFSGQNLANCARVAELTDARGSASANGYNSENPDPTAIPVLTTNAQGQPEDLNFMVIAFCGGNVGNIQLTP